MPKNFCVLIPSYNEAKTIGSIVESLKDKRLTVYVVDDGSTDNTADIAVSKGATLIRHMTNKGKGAALREGFKAVIETDFEAVLVMDGDDQHEVDDIDGFITKMDNTGSDMVIGNRMSDTSSMPYHRIKTNKFMSWLISKIAGHRIPDTQCGFRLIKMDVLKNVSLESSNYEIETEMIVAAARKRFKIESVPVKTIYEDQTSKINPVIDTIRFIILILKLFIRK